MISREYPTVLKRSKNRAAMEKMHNTPISESETNKLVFEYLDEDEVAEVRFSCTSGRAAACYRGEETYLRFTPGGKLTKGIVLHEIAHIINSNDRHGRQHDDSFVKVLDGLIWSEEEWTKNPYTSLF